MNIEYKTFIGVGLVILLVAGIYLQAFTITDHINYDNDELLLCEQDTAKWKNHSMVLKAAISFIPEINDSIYVDDIASGIGRTAYLEHNEFNTSKYEIWCHNGYVWYVTVDDSGDIVEVMRVTGATAIRSQLSIKPDVDKLVLN